MTEPRNASEQRSRWLIGIGMVGAMCLGALIFGAGFELAAHSNALVASVSSPTPIESAAQTVGSPVATPSPSISAAPATAKPTVAPAKTASPKPAPPPPTSCHQPTGAIIYSTTQGGTLQTPPFQPPVNYCSFSVAWRIPSTCQYCGGDFVIQVVSVLSGGVVASGGVNGAFGGESGVITVGKGSGSTFYLNVSTIDHGSCDPGSAYCVTWTVTVLG